ncbi:Uncharacterised protein [Limosilactobacillus oris]|nr:Uncharacterised protein [Limosilactobacillus oris]
MIVPFKKLKRGCDISPITLIKSEQRGTQMGFRVRQNRTPKPYLCSRGLENEVVNDFCLAPFTVLKTKMQ